MISRTPDPNHYTYSTMALSLPGYRKANCLSGCVIPQQLHNGGLMALPRWTWSRCLPLSQGNFLICKAKPSLHPCAHTQGSLTRKAFTTNPPGLPKHHPKREPRSPGAQEPSAACTSKRLGCLGRSRLKVLSQVPHWTSKLTSSNSSHQIPSQCIPEPSG